MSVTDTIDFSSNEYLNNGVFMRHIDAAQKIKIDTDYTEEEKHKEILEIRLKLQIEAHVWLRIFKNAKWWREGLE